MNLAGAAITGARRVRRRRVVGSALGVALVAGLVVATPRLLLNPPVTAPTVMSSPPATTAAPSPVTRTAAASAPVDLPGGWVVAGAADLGSGVVLDRARNRYVTINGRQVVPAPTGTRAALVDAFVVQIVEGGNIGRKIPLTSAAQPQWSPTGDRLLLTQGTPFVIIDAKTGATMRHAVDHSRYQCNDHCFFEWHRDGREVGYALTDTAQRPGHSEDQPDAQRGVQLFDASTGTPTRFLPVKGATFGPYAWSPDGTRVMVGGVTTEANGRRRAQTQIRDIRTWELLGTLPYEASQVWWATDDQLFAHADSTIVVFRPDGTVTETIAR